MSVLLDDAPRVGEERPLGADRGAELLERVVLVGRDRDDLGVGHGDLRVERGELEVLLVLLRAVVAAREREDQRVVALELAEPPGDVRVVGQLVVGERAAGGDVGAHGDRLPCGDANGGRVSQDELLAAVDVVRRPGEGGVGHEVHGERGDVGRPDDAPDRQRGAELVAARVELVAEQRRRQRGVDEAGGDQVDADRRELEREAGRQGGQRRGRRRDDPDADGGWRAAGAAHEQQRAAGADLAAGVAGDAEHHHGCSGSARRASSKSISASGA